MTTMNRIFRSGMLAAGLAAGFVLAMPAQAASTYQGAFNVTLTVKTTQDGVIITGDTEGTGLNANASGNIGTFASASIDLDPNDPTVLGEGDALTMDASMGGESVNGPSLNTATSLAQGEGVVTVQNTSQDNAKIVFELIYALSGSAAIDNPAFDSAFLNVLFEISTPSGISLSESVTVDLPAGGLSGDGTLGDTRQFTLALDADDFDTISLSATLNGIATTQPVPLPAALPLFAAGLAAVGLTARRRHARSA